MAKDSIMIDLETLCTLPTATVLTIGAVRFDVDGKPEDILETDKLYIRVDIDSCAGMDLSISDSTLQWWGRQSESAQEEAFGGDNRTPIADALSQLHKFCWGSKFAWSHGATFDLVILEHLYRKVGKTAPWRYFNARDTRTLFNLGIEPGMPATTAHKALDDAYAQAVAVQNVYRVLRSKGI